jgi:hypothetical protein
VCHKQLAYANEAVQIGDIASGGCQFTLKNGKTPLVLCKEVRGEITWKRQGEDRPTKQTPSINYIVKCTLCSDYFWRDSLLQHLKESQDHQSGTASYKNMEKLGARNKVSENLVKLLQLGTKRKAKDKSKKSNKKGKVLEEGVEAADEDEGEELLEKDGD